MLEQHYEHSKAELAALNWTVHEPPNEDRIRLALLDDHGLFRASLARLLASEAGFEIAGECGTPAEALEVIHASSVDIVLLDFDVGPEHANDFISAARKAGYQGRFLIVAGSDDAERSAMVLKQGVSGIFLKSEAPERLIQAIRVIASGATWVDQKIIRALANQCLSQPRRADQRSASLLDDRQQRVILGILGGLTNRKIADGMGISESAVKNILQAMFSRTGVRTRSQLVRLALEGSLGNVQYRAKPAGKVKVHEDEVSAPPPPEPHDATPTRR